MELKVFCLFILEERPGNIIVVAVGQKLQEPELYFMLVG